VARAVTGPATLLGVPWDGGASFQRGAAAGPAAIRAALHSPAGNAWTEALVDLGDPVVLQDAGDVPLGDPDDGAAARHAITTAVARVLAGGGRPVVLGGDHSITYPVLRAVRAVHPRLTLLHVDAHMDLYDEFEGDRWSHACPFARIMEERLCDRLVQVGIRTATPHQRQQAARFGVEVIDMLAWAQGVRPVVQGPTWVSLDLDGLDPAFAPGVAHREPGGLSTREVLALLHAVDGPLVGGDLVELTPALDPTGLSATVAAKLVRELIGTMARPR
jgi:agmatinase